MHRLALNDHRSGVSGAKSWQLRRKKSHPVISVSKGSRERTDERLLVFSG